MTRFSSLLRSAVAMMALCGAAMLAPQVAHADSPPLVPVQGTLYDADGLPVNGTVNVLFALYGDAGLGTMIWGDTVEVNVTNGLFTAYLGEESPLNLVVFRNNTNLWLTISVDGDTAMGPYRIATAPFAGFAQYCGDAVTLGGQTREQIVNAAVAAVGGPYAPLDHRTLWSTIDGMPSGFADGLDNVRSDDEIRGVVSGMGYVTSSHTHAWSQITSMPAGFADGVDNMRSDDEIRTVVGGMNLAPAAHTHGWSQITGIPAGFADGVDDVRSDTEIRAVVGGMNLPARGGAIEIVPGSCQTSGYVNDFDAAVNFTCPSGKIMIGTSSYHDNGKEDRRYSFTCCSLRIAY